MPARVEAGERHHIDIGVRRNGFTDRRAVAIDKIEHAFGQAGLVQHLGQHNGAKGRFRSATTTVQPAASAGANFRRDLVDWPVPGGVMKPQTPIGSRTIRVVPIMWPKS